MNRSQELREIVAHLCQVETATIAPNFSLKSHALQSSVRRAALAAAIRRQLGMTCPEIYTLSTFGELEAALLETSSSPGPNAKEPVEPEETLQIPESIGGNSFTCGIDFEMVESMPHADDYWEHEFYTESFSPDEIAYCVLQTNPRMHFAARWCAKEALIKCKPTFKSEKLANLEILRSQSGEISLAHRVNGSRRMLPIAVSVSHTDQMAVAVVFGTGE